MCYKVLICQQCAKLGSLSFKSYHFKGKSLGKMYKLLNTGITKSSECGQKKPHHVCFVVIHNMWVVFWCLLLIWFEGLVWGFFCWLGLHLVFSQCVE